MTHPPVGVVAIVDDDHAALESLKFLLEVVGYKVATYASAQAFLDDRAAASACLILDHHMPRMTGLDLVQKLREQKRDIPVLLITGSSSPAIVARAAELGVARVLDKPPREDDLLRFVSACL
jgi:two-component system, LuxR family, response regulator FixJ